MHVRDESSVESTLAGVFEIKRCLGIMTRLHAKVSKTVFVLTTTGRRIPAAYASSDGGEMCTVVPVASRYA